MVTTVPSDGIELDDALYCRLLNAAATHDITDGTVITLADILCTRKQNLTTSHYVRISDGRVFVAVAHPSPQALIYPQLDLLKSRVGVAKVEIGHDGWTNAINFCDAYSSLSTLHIAPSRSYFKLAELIPHVLIAPERALHLCEAPGGFAQAAQDTWGCTSVAHSLHIPGAIRFKRLHKRVKISGSELEAGGDITHPGVVEALSAVGRAYDLVTADGSVAVDASPATAEQDNALLVAREVAVALATLRERGCLVLKLFDLAQTTTTRLLQHLSHQFGHVKIVKPLTSRPTNGELYVVCNEFHAAHCDERIVRELATATDPTSHGHVEADLRMQVSRIHATFAFKQACALRAVFDFIQHGKRPDPDASAALWRQIKPPFCTSLGKSVSLGASIVAPSCGRQRLSDC